VLLIVACVIWEIYDIVVPPHKQTMRKMMNDQTMNADTIVIANEPQVSTVKAEDMASCDTSIINTSAMNDLTHEPRLLHFESNVVLDDDNITDDDSSVYESVFRSIPSVELLNGAMPMSGDSKQIDRFNDSKTATDEIEVLNDQSDNDRDGSHLTLLSDEDIAHKIMNPLPTGCELSNAIITTLTDKYPILTRLDIVRFLVARKGRAESAIEMIDQYLVWRRQYFPLTISSVSKALQSPCFFIYGDKIAAKDGTPLVFMRGGLYDNRTADDAPLQYVLLAAHSIETLLRLYPDEINVTVIVHAIRVEGGANLPPDLTFIKLLIKVMYAAHTVIIHYSSISHYC